MSSNFVAKLTSEDYVKLMSVVKMWDVNAEYFLGITDLIQASPLKNVQENVRYG